MIANRSTDTCSSDQHLSSLKLPYPVLSDHRDLSSILDLLQSETRITSKKIAEICKQIDECERGLILNETQKKISKNKCVKYKQQLDALKKHERRVSLQIDFITTKTEIQGLEDEKKSNENEQIEILLRKLNQKLNRMKIYMRTRNEQMKKLHSKKVNIENGQQLEVPIKRLKSTTPAIRLASRITTNKYPMPSSIQSGHDHVIESQMKLISSPRSFLIQKNISKLNNKRSFDEDDELDFDLNIDELFNDHLYSDQIVQNYKS